MCIRDSKEIESWKNLLSNSEKMVSELTDRKNKLNLQLEKLDNQPKLQAEKKGQISEGLRISEKEKEDNESIIHSTDEKIDTLRAQLNEVQEQSIQIRERKASSGATIEGLKKRKSDLIDRIISELNLKQKTGSEYGSQPCPNCGGDDRFWITEHNGELMHHCRKNCEFVKRDKVLQDRGLLPKWESNEVPYHIRKCILLYFTIYVCINDATYILLIFLSKINIWILHCYVKRM